MQQINLQGSFSLEQIQFLEQAVFDVLESDFNYSLGKRKRQLIFARALGASNADALRQRLKSASHAADSELLIPNRTIETMAVDAWLLKNADKLGGRA
tara:strand:- start:283 stop:576 length:294 start_codon:yes stop_codon:yes gene_type:complete